MKIEVPELDARLADRGARQDCPICGRLEWTVDQAPAALNGMDPDTEEILLNVGVSAAILVCKNCGFIRLHSVEVLYESAG